MTNTATNARCLLLAICCLLAICSLASARTEFEAEADRLGVSFCRSPAAQQLKCGWASAGEQQSSVRSGFFGGTVWAGEPQVPSNIIHTYTFFSYYPHIVSLGCPERLVVRAVLKLNRDIACPRLVTRAITSPQATNISLVTRCELVLPPGDEVEASVKSTEVNCKPCNDCASCPAKAGQWYSDTFSFSFGGCKSVLSSNTYEPVVPAIIMNNAASILLTKFEVQPD
ncbi:hypothetical protein V8C86DRAFT_2732337, partial [Haematococcus lacustris]